MSAGHSRGDRRNVRLFLVGHLVAVALIYGVALTVGGGFAPPPFPPDERVAMRAPAGHVEPPEPVIAAGGAPNANELVGLPDRHDIEPPWRFDARGELRMPHR